MVQECYILRHGETVWNAQNRMQGWLDSPLTERGEMQAARQFELLRSRDLSGFRAWSSPLGRTMQTARIAVAPLVREIQQDVRLREIGVGAWSGQLRPPAMGGETADLDLEHYNAAPGGEGLGALRTRCRRFLDRLTQPAVIVTHGITSRMLRSLLVAPDVLYQSTPEGGQGVVWHVRDGVQTLLR